LELPRLSDAEFHLFQKLVYQEAGIWLSDAKKSLVAGRLSKRVRELGLKSFKLYYTKIVEGDEAERVRMLDCISTNQTHFFREPQHFEFLDQVIFPSWIAKAQAVNMPKTLRIWCAGCSSGEEPYSIAMALVAHSPEFANWKISIVATDISTRVLKKAKAAVWPIEKAAEIPPEYLKRFMLRGVGQRAGEMTVASELRSMVTFARLNLNDPPYIVPGPFDLILCRNVLIYFDQDSKQRVVNGLLERLAPEGFLFAGHSENLTLITDRLRTIRPTIYTVRGSESTLRTRGQSATFLEYRG
jgi:chemotaxis protein methyltransferase CheR